MTRRPVIKIDLADELAKQVVGFVCCDIEAGRMPDLLRVATHLCHVVHVPLDKVMPLVETHLTAHATECKCYPTCTRFDEWYVKRVAAMRFTVTLGDGTALSVVSANATTAHDDVARYMGLCPSASGAYVLFMRMRLADEWTKREIPLAIKQWGKTSAQALHNLAWECADDCDTCWNLCSDQTETDAATVTLKLRAHLASGHRTLSEDEVS